MRRIIPIVLALVLVASIHTSAQEMPTAQKWENVEWYSVMSWQLAGAQADSATTLFFERFLPVIMDVWPETTCLRLMTGEWSITCIGLMNDGVAGLEWEMAPEAVRMWTLLLEREGEAAAGMFETFGNATARFAMHYALKHTGGM